LCPDALNVDRFLRERKDKQTYVTTMFYFHSYFLGETLQFDENMFPKMGGVPIIGSKRWVQTLGMGASEVINPIYTPEI